MICSIRAHKRARQVVCLTFSLIGFSFEPIAAQAERKVVFPDTPKPIGTLMIHAVNQPTPLKMLGTPRGTVTVPDGKDLYLCPTPEGMRYFDTLSKLKPNDLQHLRLHDVPITEGNLKTVSGMTGLTDLDLSFSDINDSALEHITKLKNLKHLDLSSTLVRGMTLSKLKALKNLESLDLANTRIHDFAINTIVECCPDLKWLSVTNTLITDNAILKLAKLKKLRRIKMAKTSISDKNIDKLLALKDLQKLTISRTKVSPGKLKEMRKARPDVKFVSRDTDD